VRHYKKYTVWQISHQLVLDTYALVEELPRSERYGLATQMRRAVVSISSNIAEGAGRGSDTDFRRFLLMATGSSNELEAQLLAVRDLGIADLDRTERLLAQVDHARRKLLQLIRVISQPSP